MSFYYIELWDGKQQKILQKSHGDEKNEMRAFSFELGHREATATGDDDDVAKRIKNWVESRYRCINK